MALRAFELPGDLPVLVDLIPRTFQYPENPDWSIQADEAESWVDTMNGIRRIYPLVRVMQIGVPWLRDVLRGFVWEENGQPVGLTNVLRMGNTDRWIIGNVSVLPEYRRRGIARQLVEACIEYARTRGAKSLVLQVLDGNVPAYKLYEDLGFETYGGSTSLSYDHNTPPDAVPLPDGYRIAPLSIFDWKPRYEMDRRVTPPSEQRYTPIEVGRYRQPALLRPLLPLLNRAMGSRHQAFVAHRAADDQVVAVGRYQARQRAGGVNEMNATLDPACAELAPYLMRFLLRGLLQASPGRRIEIDIPDWQEPLCTAAVDAGFVRRYDMLAMGMVMS
jgi:ribosomal protein S18 acetylase RimI-like enzyme